MQPTIRALAQASHMHKPMINFLGKRQWKPESPHPHPAAPPELQRAFPDFLKKFESSASGSSSPASSPSSGRPVYGEFWEAPSWVWNPRVRVLEEAEMDAITSGGASGF
ncbi:uncharacterized protein STEHIDRAFT_122369 [Stereum hirsutum FP-91666 SS1]|uniref:uncharacterized protein n=1 Tax=Stereum hirsutum (strain FP-91666) TaxID=721885 RepID=UPI0004449491|nr:uncharacterized protein STEHIDRAFT_122369 [Stereum hirsutum FP-91666 SS1]EIM85460.1 hypothetical protein STEHIDRAFT_122369 [Stereum hirsutum FP-91666 SS1]